jgi:hypothetical protein
MKIPQKVIDHCASHKLCKGCPINCVAPVSDREFESWMQVQIKKVLLLNGIAQS